MGMIDTVLDRIGYVPSDALREVSGQLQHAGFQVDNLTESVAELERQLSEPEWIRMQTLAVQEFTNEGLIQLRSICRLMYIKNPLIKRGLHLRSAYVWGQGVEITARANGKNPGEQDVQKTVVDFLTDPGNARAVTGAVARDKLEHALGHDGEVYVVCFTNPRSGFVKVRPILPDEITEIITSPGDKDDRWYYRRTWTQNIFDLSTGKTTVEKREEFYPDIDYRPATRPRAIGGAKVNWDAPIISTAVNSPLGWMRGIPDAYAAIDWALGYKDFLTDWARLMRSLSRYAWKATSPGSKSTQLRSAITRTPSKDAVSGQPNAAGATLNLPPDVTFEAINKSGATIDSESGRPLAMQVASALDVPVTMLLGDPGQTGARATAETLDAPTELTMNLRREVWAGFYQRILLYVITESVRAPQGALKGIIRRDDVTGREVVALAGDTPIDIDIVWPDIDDVPPSTLVEAIVKAASTMTLPPEIVARMLLNALGVRNVDGIIEELTDADGNFQWPSTPPIGGQDQGNNPGAGGDPGPMGGEDPTPPDEPAADVQPASGGGTP